jgi:uncharacterized protein (TIGR02453 family)
MLNPDLLTFLTELKENNNKEWFEKNRPRYKELREHFINFISLLIHEISAFDKSIGHPEAKKTVFRINRDIRFSPDKQPYKTNMGSFISGGGKKAALPGYYFHVEPGAGMLAGGMYMPPGPELKKIRKEIFENPEEYRSIINDKNFEETFGEIHGEKLKTAPQGYPKDHPDIELIRYKSYTVFREVDDSFFTGPDLMNESIRIYKSMKPLNDFLNRALQL